MAVKTYCTQTSRLCLL